MVRSHFVVIPDETGKPTNFPLKQWLRENPDENPPGLHPDENSSHALRRGLKRLGWRLQFTPTEVLVIKPDKSGSTSYAEDLIDQAEMDDASEIPDDIDVSTELTFGLERDLQLALRSGIEQLELGLSVIDGGSEYTTPAGRVDILAQDSSGSPVVVELKAGRAGSKVIAQILAYMSAVSAERGVPARGIIVAGEFDQVVVLASKAVASLRLRKYTYQFRFSDLP